jgi:hypothetical protein
MPKMTRRQRLRVLTDAFTACFEADELAATTVFSTGDAVYE